MCVCFFRRMNRREFSLSLSCTLKLQQLLLTEREEKKSRRIQHIVHIIQYYCMYNNIYKRTRYYIVLILRSESNRIRVENELLCLFHFHSFSNKKKITTINKYMFMYSIFL